MQVLITCFLFRDTHKINDGALTFEPLSEDDQALYQCTAENEFGRISSSAFLTVQEGIFYFVLL